MAPRIESDPGQELRAVWVYLDPSEAHELRDALNEWAAEEARDLGWHTHVTDAGGRELTLAIGEASAT